MAKVNINGPMETDTWEIILKTNLTEMEPTARFMATLTSANLPMVCFKATANFDSAPEIAQVTRTRASFIKANSTETELISLQMGTSLSARFDSEREMDVEFFTSRTAEPRLDVGEMIN